MVSRTKIVCTMGPAVSDPAMIDSLIGAGMNVARINFSHGTHEEHGVTIDLVKAARARACVPLAVMLDTKGPEIRLGKIQGEGIQVHSGDRFRFVKEEVIGTAEAITLAPAHALDVLEEGMTILLDDGYIITRVIKKENEGVVVEVVHGGVIKSKKSVNLPGVDVPLPALTDKDVADLKFGCQKEVDIIAASFVRSAEDVMAIKKLLVAEGKPEIAVIAKIENRQGVENFDSIVQVADGIMVARGDLGVELPLTQVPSLQKMMIRKSYLAGKPAVTATQMLESMIVNPRPTRAEASDVANAIYDSTSAVMLSAETAVGRYPVETVKVMKAIIRETEKDFNYAEFLKQCARGFPDVPSSVAQASIRTAYGTRAKAVFAFTTSGSTARLLSRLRPEMPIIAMTPSEKVYHQLSLSWGVIPILSQEPKTIEEAYKKISEFALEQGYVNYGDLVVITAGTPFGRAGTTNMMIIDSIGDVLVRGSEGLGEKVHGKVALVTSPSQEALFRAQGKILLLNQCDASYLPLLKHASGVILQNHVDDVASEQCLKEVAKELNLPILLRADGAGSVLREEQLITLDPHQAIVFKGIIS